MQFYVFLNDNKEIYEKSVISKNNIMTLIYQEYISHNWMYK